MITGEMVLLAAVHQLSSPGDLKAVAAISQRFRAEASSGVLSALDPFISHIATVIQNNPASGIGAVLQRPDVQSELTRVIVRSRSGAFSALEDSWSHAASILRPVGSTSSPYLDSLRSDLQVLYGGMPTRVVSAITSAFGSVQPAASYHQGGAAVNVPVETAQERAAAVTKALRKEAGSTALRSGLTASVAALRSFTESQLIQVAVLGTHAQKKWVSRLSPTTCPFCAHLHGTVVPIHSAFPYPSHIGKIKAPKPYGTLVGPPLHPHCECHLEFTEPKVTSPPAAEPPGKAEEPAMFRASDIRALPEERYSLLVAFIKAALSSVAKIIKRLLGI